MAEIRNNYQPPKDENGKPLKCNVCEINDAIGVASSTLGAISFAYCLTCLKNNADAEMMFVCTFWTCGNEVHDGIKLMKTFKNGEYISWDDWVSKYGAEAIKGMDEEYEKAQAGQMSYDDEIQTFP